MRARPDSGQRHDSSSGIPDDSATLSASDATIARMEVTTADATVDRWPDVVTVMGTRGDPARCWCQFFRITNREWQASDVDAFRAQLRAQLDDGPPGVLAYCDGEPVGWCAVGPRSAYSRLATSAIASATQDGAGVWAVTCFVVRVGHRRNGVADRLLAAAVDLARRRGASIVEGYPVDATARTKPSSAELYHGPLSVFLRGGFTEAARPKPDRAVVRLAI